MPEHVALTDDLGVEYGELVRAVREDGKTAVSEHERALALERHEPGVPERPGLQAELPHLKNRVEHALLRALEQLRRLAELGEREAYHPLRRQPLRHRKLQLPTEALLASVL